MSAPVLAQQAQPTAPPLGSPAATITIPGDQLPPPPQKFGGKIEELAPQSKPYWPARVVPPKGAPNVLLIMTDDAGFGVPSTFGGVIPTPALDRIAQNGLRYTNFNSTALCSPTRAALITGRNHHSAGFGVVSEQATGFPGYNSIISRDKATVGRILRDNGYHTSWFGKNHNTPEFQASQAGPFDQWPVGMGFEYFYGFVGGDTNQWQPNLFRNTTQIYPFQGQPPGTWNLTTAMADDAIDYMKRMSALTPEQPFFVYYVPGGTHAPHHPTKEWIDKIGGMHLFDQGWNKLREQIFANQKKLGVIPQNAKLTPWPSDMLKEWDTLSADEKKLFTKQADVFGAYVAYTDHEIGRVIQAVEDMGKLDNTLIIYIEGDNGTSAEGTMIGTPNEIAMFNGVNPNVEEQLKYFYDVWGTDKTYNHMALPWAWAFDTPFSWTKQIASHFGGIRQGMAISWPAVIKDKGGIRNQFHHMIDITPTILEAAKIKQPTMVDGIKQSPIEGVSMMYSFDAKSANAPSAHKTQYFEMMGDRGIYHEGWFAANKVGRKPWENTAPPLNLATTQWELYDLRNDWTQADDLAAKNPAKLKELTAVFEQEAKKYQVLPLDNSLVARAIVPKPSITAGRDVFTWTGPLAGIPNGDAPSILNSSYSFKAEIDVPQDGGEGMLITQGGRFGGYGFYLLKGKPKFVWNLVGLKHVQWESPDVLAAGKHTLEFVFKYEGMGAATMAFGSYAGLGQGGTGVLMVDGKNVATQTMEHTLPFILQFDESLDIGSDTLTGVNDADYQPPFNLTAKIRKITLTIDRPKLTPDDIKKLEQAKQKAAAARE
ncbi:arylsulfatase [uncultured Bradyrhizobium sp.]|uniref:arylsulfatase n=1 Tax=uncultured Bradyrhizobium sp. TaxID=199684 RepID=UPI0026066D89|nr:arylsulfatase [uncultured Bradyrhizobium sp.]